MHPGARAWAIHEAVVGMEEQRDPDSGQLFSSGLQLVAALRDSPFGSQKGMTSVQEMWLGLTYGRSGERPE